ncbi:hypothetical protein QBC43DRAFT_28326 [Cladorrhinum sp. PSN259]|nr:hypothetical protein QBC43DRAFT_28326 [Cladorrhinum sp. PSN259]
MMGHSIFLLVFFCCLCRDTNFYWWALGRCLIFTFLALGLVGSIRKALSGGRMGLGAVIAKNCVFFRLFEGRVYLYDKKGWMAGKGVGRKALSSVGSCFVNNKKRMDVPRQLCLFLLVMRMRSNTKWSIYVIVDILRPVSLKIGCIEEVPLLSMHGT